MGKIIMEGSFNVKYEKYSGKVWVSVQTDSPSQGFNVATLQENGELRVLGYTNRDETKNRTLDQAVHGILKSYGWFDHVINRLLAEDDEIASCTICTNDFHENDVNLIDYQDDVCIVCEPKYKLSLTVG
jgi:hypothetical protein